MEVKNYFATDSQGNVLGSAQVYLYLAGTTTLATGLQNISGAALANPFVSQSNGLVQFKAPDGNYDLRVVKPGREFTIRIQCFDGIEFSLSLYGSFTIAKESKTVRVPSDYTSLNDAFGKLFTLSQQVQINVLIENGYQISEQLSLSHGDYSNFNISSESPSVSVNPSFPRISILKGYNSRMPTLSCLIDANSLGMNGIEIECCSMVVAPNCGVKNAYNTGMLANNASNVAARGSKFEYAARNGSTGAGITSWASLVDATDASTIFSGYYGAQAAHGGTLTFERGNTNDAYRYGLRGSDAGRIDFSEGQASRCGVYGIYSFQNSHINAPGATAIDCGSANVVATNCSTINFRNGFATGAKKVVPSGSASNYGHNLIAIGAGSSIEAYGVDARNAADTGAHVELGGVIDIAAGQVSGSINRGVTITTGGQVSGRLLKANACGTGIYADEGGKFTGLQLEATNCTVGSIVLNEGADVSIPLALLTGGATFGCRVLNGSRLNIRGASCMMGSTDNPLDIQCFSGSHITALGATGGLNRTANTLSVQGVIYR